MTHLLSSIFYLWMPFIVISRVIGTNAIHGSGLLRGIPTLYMYSPILTQKHRILYVPPAIVPEEEAAEEVMDHGELEWDFLTEKLPEPHSLQSIMLDTNDSSKLAAFMPPFAVQWFRICLFDYFRLSFMYNECEDPSQIIFLFV